MAAARGAVAMSEATEAVTAQVEVAAVASVTTITAVLPIGLRVATVTNETAEAQLPHRGSEAAVTEFPAGVAVAATMAVAAAAAPSGAPYNLGQIDAATWAL